MLHLLALVCSQLNLAMDQRIRQLETTSSVTETKQKPPKDYTPVRRTGSDADDQNRSANAHAAVSASVSVSSSRIRPAYMCT